MAIEQYFQLNSLRYLFHQLLYIELYHSCLGPNTLLVELISISIGSIHNPQLEVDLIVNLTIAHFRNYDFYQQFG